MVNVEQFMDIQNKLLVNQIIIVKFTAKWCKPCRDIHDNVSEWIQNMPSNVNIIDIDIDKSSELYAKLKSKKMLKGVPTILAYYGDVERDYWYIPDNSVSGSEKQKIATFFNKCLNKAQNM